MNTFLHITVLGDVFARVIVLVLQFDCWPFVLCDLKKNSIIY